MAPDVSDLVDLLNNATHALSPSAILATGGDGLRSPGLYSWWVDAEGAVDLSRGLGANVAPGLIYAGLAGATRSRSGRKSKNTLWGRIKSMHLGGRHEFSTFRLSLGVPSSPRHAGTKRSTSHLPVWTAEGSAGQNPAGELVRKAGVMSASSLRPIRSDEPAAITGRRFGLPALGWFMARGRGPRLAQRPSST